MLAFPQNSDPNTNKVNISIKTLARSLFTSKETNPPHGRGTVSGRRGAAACCNSAIARRRRRPRERGGFHRSHGFFFWTGREGRARELGEGGGCCCGELGEGSMRKGGGSDGFAFVTPGAHREMKPFTLPKILVKRKGLPLRTVFFPFPRYKK